MVTVSGFLLPLPGFGKQQSTSADFEGAIITSGGKERYVVEYGLKRLIPSGEILQAFYFETRKVERVSGRLFAEIPKGDPLGIFSSWPDGTLLKGRGVRVYLVSKNQRRWIVNEKVFIRWGFRWNRITSVPDDVLARVVEGTPLIGNPPPHPDTTILSGPEQHSVIERQTFTFAFTGSDGAGSRDVNFETFLEGFDSRWIPTTRAERSFTVEKEERQYTFLVRTVSKDGRVDPTPERRSFTVRLSPWSKYVRLGSVTSSGSTPDEETIQLEVDGRVPNPIGLTGYTVSNGLGAQFRIPTVQNYYRAGVELPSEDPLVVPAGGRVIIIVGKTRMRKSVRLNRCMRYLEPQMNTVFGFGFGSCPVPSEEQIRRETGSKCFEFISKQSACSMPNPIGFPDNVRLGLTCIDFISRHYTYNGCVDDHQIERDFFLNDWRVEIGYPQRFLATGSETIEVRDGEGLLVDRFERRSFGF